MNNQPYQKIGPSLYSKASIVQILTHSYGVEVILSTGLSLHLHLSKHLPDPKKLANLISLGSDVPSAYVTEHPCPDMLSNFLPAKKSKPIPTRPHRKPFTPSQVTEPLKGPSWLYPDSFNGRSGSSGNGGK